VLSGCGVRRPMGLGCPDWGSDRRPSRTIGHNTWGRLLVLLLGSVGLSHACGGVSNIDAAAGELPRVDDAMCIVVGYEPTAYRGRGAADVRLGRDVAAASRSALGGSTSCRWTEGYGYCEPAPATGQEAACQWRDAELSSCYMAACSTNVWMLRWSSCCRGPQARAGCVRASQRRQCLCRPVRTAEGRGRP
jgi:hypothetical protein